MPAKLVIPPGTRFGRLTVISETGSDLRGRRRFLCRCECLSERSYALRDLTFGDTTSCGCSKNWKHGEAKGDTPEYRCWEAMKARCYNPNSDSFKDYGDKGISVCERWRDDFVAFLADMGRMPARGMSLDRFPNGDGNYEPGNVRWATTSQQLRNRRNNVYVTYEGQRVLAHDVAIANGFWPRTVVRRVKRGLSIEQALKGLQKRVT